jgi:hypothetical protein
MNNRYRIATVGLAAALFVIVGLSPASARADVYNLKVVTDASPDYTDMDSLVHSITSQWETDQEKMWSLYYWLHKARRQTNPMTLHGKHETDPIRQFNDYGFLMCSTISGSQIAIWQHMGYPARYFDIAVHSVAEVFFDGRWNHYDNSLSAVYTLCDGKTIAGIEDIGKTLACDASHGKAEAGHIAIYHCLNGTSVDGFIEGADTMRELRYLGEKTYKPEHLKFRTYVTYAESGHRYILNLRDGQTYARHYTRLDIPESGSGDKFQSDPAYFVPNGNNSDGTPRDPEAKNPRYRIRGNGHWTFQPELASAGLAGTLHTSANIQALNPGLQPVAAGQPAEAVFKIEGANVITSMKIDAEFHRQSGDDRASISISTNNGMTWSDHYTAEAIGSDHARIQLIEPVNGAYEVLVKVQLQARSAPADARLTSIRFDTITALNSKTQPQLNIGRNTIYIGAEEQTESIVVWPELQNDRYLPHVVESHNVKTREQHEGWNGVMGVVDKSSPGHIVFRIDAPWDITRLTQGARMYVRNRNARIDFLHSFDDGKTWQQSHSFADTEQPWDDIHHQITEEIPAGTRSVLVKYVLNDASLYSVRMEVNHKPANETFKPIEVSFNWSERQEDYSLVERSHTQLVEKLPFTYTINVDGADHPVVNSLTVNLKGARGELAYGYSDGRDVGGDKWIGNWVTYGRNFAKGKPYTVSIPSGTNWDAGDPDGTRLTDGRVGSSYSGGTSYREAALWSQGQKPEITVDLGQPEKISVFRIHIHGYPAQDAIRGRIKDKVEVLVSNDGETFTSQGYFDFNLRWKDVPVNYIFTDEETFNAHNHTLLLDQPIEARFVKFRAEVGRHSMAVTEVQALDGMNSVPFDLKVALPADVDTLHAGAR